MSFNQEVAQFAFLDTYTDLAINLDHPTTKDVEILHQFYTAYQTVLSKNENNRLGQFQDNTQNIGNEAHTYAAAEAFLSGLYHGTEFNSLEDYKEHQKLFEFKPRAV